MQITHAKPIRAILLTSPRAATWGKDGDRKTTREGAPLVSARLMFLDARNLTRWVEWPGEPVEVKSLPQTVEVHGLTVDMYDKRDGTPGVAVSCTNVTPA